MNQFLKNKSLSGARYFILLLIIWIVLGGLLLIFQSDKAFYIAVNGIHTKFGDWVLPWLTHAGTFPFILICLLALYFFPSLRTQKILLAVILCNLIPFLIIQGLKIWINAPRPLNYFHNAHWINFVPGQPHHLNLSFPSGHSEGIFSLCCFLSLLLPPKYAKWGIFLFIFAILIGFSRIYLSQHFLLDVYGGSLIGAISVLIIFSIINPLSTQPQEIQNSKII